jgi:hypothetical protein
VWARRKGVSRSDLTQEEGDKNEWWKKPVRNSLSADVMVFGHSELQLKALL